MEIRIPTSLWAILFIASLALLLAGPLWQIPGIPLNGADAYSHIHRSEAMYRAFEQDVYWPRWFPTVYNGLGAPTFHHYSPGLYWMVAAIRGAGVGLDQALKLVVTAALILSACGVYAWLRHVFSPVAGLAGAALYLCEPFILMRALYFSGGYPQLLALLLLPVCLWAFTALHKEARARYWLAAVGALVALVFSHNLTAMTGAGVLTLYCLLLAVGYRKLDGLLRCALAALLAALLAAAFWLPALADMPLVQIDNGRKGVFDFSDSFLNWWQLFSLQSHVLDSRAGNPLMEPASLGAASWLALAAGLVSSLFVTRKEIRNWGLAGTLFVLAVLTLTLSVSDPLWEAIPALGFIQFPSRFLSIALLGALPAAALAIDAWPDGRRWLPALALLTAPILFLFPFLFPVHTSTSVLISVKTLTAEDTRLLEPSLGNWGMTSSNEFLVQGGDMGVVSGRTTEPSATRLTWHSPHEAVVDLSGQTEPTLLRLHYHPGWSAGNGATLAAGPVGWMQVTDLRDPSLPLAIRWEGTVAQRWGERLSLVGLIASAAGLLFLALRRRARPKADWAAKLPAAPHFPSLAPGVLVGCVLVFVVLRYAIDRSTGGPFLRHSPPGQLAFLAEGQPTTLGDASTSQVTLLGWELMSSEMPKPGGTVRVRLYWQPGARISEEMYSFLHLYSPSLQRSWAVRNWGMARPGTHGWNRSKYYVEDLRLGLPADLPPVSYSLVAGLVNSHGDRLTVPGTTDNMLHLRTLDVQPTRPGFLQRERPTIIARAATDDGLRLQGYDLLSESDRPTINLFWETGDGVANDWIVYIHMHNDMGDRIAQFDGPALAGLQPTSQWHADALYIDRRQLNLPTELQPGAYLLRIGLYSIASGERLPLRGDDDAQDHFEDGQLVIPLTVAPFSGASD